MNKFRPYLIYVIITISGILFLGAIVSSGAQGKYSYVASTFQRKNTRYHRLSCCMVNKMLNSREVKTIDEEMKKEIPTLKVFKTSEEARNQGYTSCGICRPPTRTE